jgi:hypothetical protein
MEKKKFIYLFKNSHLTPAATWANKSVAEWTDEIGGIQEALAKFANIPKTSIRVQIQFLNKSLMFINWIKIPGCTSAVLAVKW